MTERHGYGNMMAVPKVSKIVVNMGLGEARDDSKVLERASRELATIALQRPVVTRARKSVSNFKIRAGMPVGLKVTLRGKRSEERRVGKECRCGRSSEHVIKRCE